MGWESSMSGLQKAGPALRELVHPAAPLNLPPSPPRPALCHHHQAVPMLFLWETKRKDRLEVFAHHVATIILIAYSYYLKCGWAWGCGTGVAGWGKANCMLSTAQSLGGKL